MFRTISSFLILSLIHLFTLQDASAFLGIPTVTINYNSIAANGNTLAPDAQALLRRGLDTFSEKNVQFFPKSTRAKSAQCVHVRAVTGRANDTLTYDSENRLKEIQAYEGTTSTQQYTLKPGWNVVSFTWLPDNPSVSKVLKDLVYGTDYDQVSTWDSSSSAWKHWVNDSDFNDFTEFQRGKTYEIYNKTQSDKTFSVTGKSSGPDISHSIVSGDNFISPAVKTATNVSTVLSGLTLGTHYSDVKRFNATSQTWESYAGSAFTQFEPGKGYNIVGLTTANFSYGNTQQTTTMVYDSTGARVKKTTGGVTTTYLGKDYEVESSVTTKHIFLGDRRITTKKSNGDIFFIHGDHINSSNVVTDSSGNQSILLEFDPYGETVTQTGSADLKHKFTGQERDDSSHLYYYNARYYDPQIGRFITADPTVQQPKDPQDLNRYAYARNNPIKFTDPTGLGFFSWLKKLFKKVGAVIGAVVGAIIGAVIGFVIAGPPGAVLGAKIGGTLGGAIGGGFQAALNGAGPLGILNGVASGGAMGYGIGSGIGAGIQGLSGGGGAQTSYFSLKDGGVGFDLTNVRAAVGSTGASGKIQSILTNLVTNPVVLGAGGSASLGVGSLKPTRQVFEAGFETSFIRPQLASLQFYGSPLGQQLLYGVEEAAGNVGYAALVLGPEGYPVFRGIELTARGLRLSGQVYAGGDSEVILMKEALKVSSAQFVKAYIEPFAGRPATALLNKIVQKTLDRVYDQLARIATNK